MRRPRLLPYAGLAVAAALALSGCGPDSTTSGSGPAAGSTPAPTSTAGGGQAAGQRQPGVSGMVAAVSGSTMQVQTRTDQTAVSWSNTTAFTTLSAASLSDVKVGSCVTVTEPPATASATQAAPSTPAASVSAASVQIRPAVNGACTGFGGGGFGGPGAGQPPTGTRTDVPNPSGTAGRNGFGRRIVAGQVTAVEGSAFTVQETPRGRGTGTATASARAVQTVQVTTSGTTTFLAQRAGTAADVVVGSCATAIGRADDTGAVTATAITLRPAVGGSCTTGARPGAGSGNG